MIPETTMSNYEGMQETILHCHERRNLHWKRPYLSIVMISVHTSENVSNVNDHVLTHGTIFKWVCRYDNSHQAILLWRNID